MVRSMSGRAVVSEALLNSSQALIRGLVPVARRPRRLPLPKATVKISARLADFPRSDPSKARAIRCNLDELISVKHQVRSVGHIAFGYATWSGGTMTRETLFYRLSVCWLVALAVGCAYVLTL